MTAEEIIKLISEKDLSVYDLEEQDGTKEAFGEIEVVDEKGDCEGGGDYSMKVFHFKDHNCFIKVTGFYSSYNGTDWDSDWKEVAPKEKLITVYE